MSDEALPPREPISETFPDAPEYLFHILGQVVRRRDNELEKVLKPIGLTASLWRALLMIRRMKSCTMNELSQMTTVERTTLTRIVDQLVTEGLVERSTPVEDRRQVLIGLTDKGHETFDQAMDLIRPFHSRTLVDIDAERRREITRGLRQMIANLVDEPSVVEGVLTVGRPATPVPDPD